MIKELLKRIETEEKELERIEELEGDVRSMRIAEQRRREAEHEHY